jgi:hypothetical protein
VDEERTDVPGLAIRLLQAGDEDVVRELATYDGPGDPEGLLADPRTLLLVAFDGDLPVGFVLAHELPRRHGDRRTSSSTRSTSPRAINAAGSLRRCSHGSPSSRASVTSGSASY